ncbi:MAG: hypothetical protein WCF57_20205 [Pyrinomonadaceae bacterium]
MRLNFYLWKFIHNAPAHFLKAWPYEPQWVERFHNWTARKWGESEG